MRGRNYIRRTGVARQRGNRGTFTRTARTSNANSYNNNFSNNSRNTKMQYAKGKARPPLQIQRFSRMLNQVAEKKYKVTWTHPHANWWLGISPDHPVPQPKTILAGQSRIFRPKWPEVGTAKDQRVGKKIFARYWKFTGVIYLPTPTVFIRVSVVWPKRPEYQSYAAVGTAPHIPQYMQPWDIEKFSVISDEYIHNNTMTHSFNCSKKIKIFKSFTFLPLPDAVPEEYTSANLYLPVEAFPMIVISYDNAAYVGGNRVEVDENGAPRMNASSILSYTDV